MVDLFGNEPYDVLPINRAAKRGNQDVMEFINIAIDFLMNTGWSGRPPLRQAATLDLRLSELK